MAKAVKRRKTTLYLDQDLLRGAKLLAAVTDRSESEVVEEALQGYLSGESAATARNELTRLLERIAMRSTITEDRALQLAHEELRASRTDAG